MNELERATSRETFISAYWPPIRRGVMKLRSDSLFTDIRRYLKRSSLGNQSVMKLRPYKWLLRLVQSGKDALRRHWQF